MMAGFYDERKLSACEWKEGKMSEETTDNIQDQYAYRISEPPYDPVIALLTEAEADELKDKGYSISCVGYPEHETPTEPMQASWGRLFKAIWFRLRHTLARGPSMCGFPSWRHPYEAWFCSQCGGVLVASSPAYGWRTA
jgi:hypothetical protein